jgi:hypothetical protein
MKLAGSLIMLAVGVIVALAVTIRTPWLDVPLAGWSLALGGAAGLLVDVLRQKAGAKAQDWQVWAPRLLAIGAIGWLALHTPGVPYVDLPTVGFILFLVGVGLCAGAVYDLSGWRLGTAMREMWRTPEEEERTRTLPAPPTDRQYRDDPYRDRPYQDGPYRDEPYRDQPYRDQPYRSNPYREQPYGDGSGRSSRRDDPPTQTMRHP